MKTLVLDLETTGLPQKGHTYDKDFMSFPYIVTLAYKVNEGETKEFIINQEGREIPEEATKIHGVTNEIANASPYTLHNVLVIMLNESEGAEVVIGHNIYFDTSTIKANILRLIQENKLPQESYAAFENLLHKDRRVDTMQKTIKFCGLGGKWPKLTELHFKLFGCLPEESHKSGADVDTTHKCYLKLKELAVI